jgi:hypothetical protein
MKKNLNNIYLFPGVVNPKIQDMELDMCAAQERLNHIFSLDDYEFGFQKMKEKDLEILADYGDVMSFNSLTARRLISVLALMVIKQEEVINELEDLNEKNL